MKLKNFTNWKGLILFALVALLTLSSSILSAQHKILLSYRETPIKTVLKEITSQTGYDFIYSGDFQELNGHITISLNSANESIENILTSVFKGKDISYEIKNKKIMLAPRRIVLSNDQRKPVKGVVKDDLGEGIPGAAVKNTATNKIVATDFNGQYSIEANEGDLLVFSSIGMAEKQMPVGKGDVLNISMTPDIIALEDVVVTGYQTISKERATGSFVRIGAEELAKKPVTDISSALRGLTPGMSISTDVNGTNRFLIRGQGTMQGVADRDPLIVVDGFAIQGFSGGVNGEKDPFASINPNDVESVTILKDAAATSIYGARAANGVIVITTKKGNIGKDKLNINVNAFVSISNKPDLEYTFNMADLGTTVKYLENLEKYASGYNYPFRDPYFNTMDPFVYLPKASELLHEYKRRGNITAQEYNDGIAKLMAQEGRWVDDYNKHIFRNAINQQYNINMNGGSQKNRYNFSVVYDRDLGMSIGNNKNKIVLNFSSAYQIIKNLILSVGVNAQISNNKNEGISLSDLKMYTTPYTRLFNEDGSYAHIATRQTIYEPILNARFGDKLAESWNYNPVQDRMERTNESKMFNTRFQAGLEYKIIEGLNISVKGQYERNQYKNKIINSQDSYLVRGYNNTFSKMNNIIGRYETFFPQGSVFTDKSDLYTSYNLRGQIDYNKNIAKKHDITVLLGGEIISSVTEVEPAYTRYGYNPKTNAVQTNPDYVTRVQNIWGKSVNYPYTSLGGLRTLEDRFISAYMNLAYTYDRKYTISGSARTDASNFISDDVRKKFSPFWSLGAAWNITSENFMKRISWINNLKLRASYGLAGVAAGKSSVSTITTLKVGTPSIIYTNNEPFSTINIKGNPALTWEKSKTLDIAIDFDLFRGKLYGSIDYYNRLSYDVLASATTPFIAQSQKSSRFNNAEISNKGVEITLGSNINITDRISWRGDFNFSYNKNVVEKYNAQPMFPGSRYEEFVLGRPVGPLYSYKLIGYTEEGYPKLEGKDGQIEVVTSMEKSHMEDMLDATKGETGDNNNWCRYVGTSIAPYNLGFTNSFKIYNFMLSFMITGKFGHLFKRNDAPVDDQSMPFFNKSLEAAMQNDYKGEYTSLPIFSDKNVDVFNTGAAYGYIWLLHNESNVMFEKADHIRLNEVFLGYEMPKRLLGGEKSFVKGLNIYAQARNLGIIWAANNKGIDPDYQWGSIKPTTTWTFGLKLNF